MYIYTYIYVYMYIYIYIYIHTHIYMYLYIYTRTHINIHIYAFIYIHVHDHLYKYTHAHLYKYTHAHARAHSMWWFYISKHGKHPVPLHVFWRVHIRLSRMCICIHIHTLTHTYTRSARGDFTTQNVANIQCRCIFLTSSCPTPTARRTLSSCRCTQYVAVCCMLLQRVVVYYSEWQWFPVCCLLNIFCCLAGCEIGRFRWGFFNESCPEFSSTK